MVPGASELTPVHEGGPEKEHKVFDNTTCFGVQSQNYLVWLRRNTNHLFDLAKKEHRESKKYLRAKYLVEHLKTHTDKNFTNATM